MNKLQKQNLVLQILSDTINSSTPVSWEVIHGVVKEKVEIKNWLTEVRSILQYLINQGTIARTKDVHSEQYICLK